MSDLPPPSILPSPKPTSLNDLSNLEEGRPALSPEDVVANTISFPTLSHKIVAELVGTYILIFTGCGSGLVESLEPNLPVTLGGQAIVWGLTTMVMIYTLGHVSGAHFNPAVTIAFATSRKFPWEHVIAYVGAQVMGSTLACCTLRALFGCKVDLTPILTKPNGHDELNIFIWEFIISFILMFVVSGVATDQRAINELSGFSVGATVLCNFIVARKITGASMNPARSLGPAIVARHFPCIWIFMVAPVLGTTTGSLIYCLLRLPKNAEKEIIKHV